MLSRLGVHWNQRLLHGYVVCYVEGRLVEILLEEALDIVVQEGVEGFLLSGDHCGRPDFVQISVRTEECTVGLIPSVQTH